MVMMFIVMGAGNVHVHVVIASEIGRVYVFLIGTGCHVSIFVYIIPHCLHLVILSDDVQSACVCFINGT